jgi:hypothetical protein
MGLEAVLFARLFLWLAPRTTTNQQKLLVFNVMLTVFWQRRRYGQA